MTNVLKEPIFQSVRQICSVVDDFDATVQRLVDELGIGPFRCWYFRPPVLFKSTLNDVPTNWSMKLAITWLDDMQWEVIQPMEGATLYRKHLNEHGRGVQHLLMGSGSISFEAAAAHMKAKNHGFNQYTKCLTPLMIGNITLPSLPTALAGPAALQFGYIDAEATLRSSIEMTRYPLGLSERFCLRSGSPEYCIPKGNHHFETPLPNLVFSRVAKITILTKNLDETVKNYCDIVNVGPWHIFNLKPEQLTHVKINDAPINFSVRVAWTLIDDVLMEIIELGEGQGADQSHYHKILATRGEGVVSVGVVPKKGLSYDKVLTHCKSKGYDMPMVGSFLGKQASAYFLARKSIATDLELIDLESGHFKTLFASTKPDKVVSV